MWVVYLSVLRQAWLRILTSTGHDDIGIHWLDAGHEPVVWDWWVIWDWYWDCGGNWDWL